MGMAAVVIVSVVVMPGMRIVVVVLVGIQVMPSVCVVVVALMGAMVVAFVGAVVMAGMRIVVVAVMGTVVIAFVQLFGRCHICGSLVEDLIRRPSNSSTVEARPGFQMTEVVVFQAIGSRFLELERQVAHSVLLVDHPSHVVQ